MVVEGFRRQGEPIMDAWEFFYSPTASRSDGSRPAI